MNIKRVAAILLIILMVSSSLVGCTTKTAETVYITIGTAGVGGSFYPIGIKLSEVWNKAIPNVKAVAIATAGSPQNVDMMRTKDSEACVLGSLDGYEAINGTGSYTEKMPWIVALTGPMYESGAQILAQNDSGINSILDIKGKKIAVGEAGGAGTADVERTLSAIGMSTKDFSPVYADAGQAIDQMKDGLIDGAFLGLTVGSAVIAEAMLSGRMKLVGIDDASFAAIKKINPNQTRYTIKANTYSNQNYDVITVADPPQIIACRQDLISDDMAYQMTKAIYDNLADFKTAVSALSQMTLESAANGLMIPYHPGTLKYFKEKGITVKGN
jgi:TRAP transporter TAXI family solute receptor